MTPTPRFDDQIELLSTPRAELLHDYYDDKEELIEALEISPSSSPTSFPSRHTISNRDDGKAWEVSTETELMLSHPHLQLSLIRSSFKMNKSPDSPSTAVEKGSETPILIDEHPDVDLPQPRTGDDEESVGYFDMDDFDSTYWIKAVTNVPTLSVAAILTTGFAIMHPWMFVLGALTILGTAHASGVSFEWLTSSSSSCESTPPENTHQQIEKLEETSSLPPTELFCRSFSPGNVTSPSVMPRDQWLNRYFPPLESPVISNQEFPGLSAAEFFQVFFSDDAPYSFMEFQKKRGDEDICYGRWCDATSKLSTMEPQALSLVSRAALLEDDDIPSVESFQHRVLTFKTFTKSYFGPPFAIATKKQTTVRHSKRCVVIESMTTLSQIPFSDRFHIIERWLIQSEKQGTPSRHVANLQVNAHVVFTAKCPFEHQIRTKSASTFSEVCKAWCAMAQQALKLTEQAKHERLQRQEQEEASMCTSMSSHCNEEDVLYGSPSWHGEWGNHESSIEVPYSDDGNENVDEEISSPSKRVKVGGLASPRLLLTKWKQSRSKRRASALLQ